jgi:hypothetical protein
VEPHSLIIPISALDLQGSTTGREVEPHSLIIPTTHKASFNGFQDFRYMMQR